MSAVPESKRQKVTGDNESTIVGPDELRSWASKLEGRFDQKLGENLLSSCNIHAVDILKFVLEFVFGWSCDVEYPDASVMCRDGEWYFCNETPSAAAAENTTHHEKMKKKDRIMALRFVTMWLGETSEGQESSLPSLATLSAQRIAMDVFLLFATHIDISFKSKNLEYFTETLRCEMASSLNNKGVPSSHHNLIMEELFIFAIVYILYIDLRRMTTEPDCASDIQLPAANRSDDCWWNNYGIRAVVDSVPDFGRGSLAKVGLLPFIVHKNFHEKTREGERGYDHIDVITKLFCYDSIYVKREHKYVSPRLYCRHPFANLVALRPVTYFVHRYFMKGARDSEWCEQILEEVLLPWMINCVGGILTDQNTSSYSFLYRVTMNSVRKAKAPVIQPFACDTSNEEVQMCFDARKHEELMQSLTFDTYWETERVKRLRLNGNYSKAEILRAAIVSCCAEVVDFEYCPNLDEECLEVVMHQLRRVKVVLLRGTAVVENKSAVVKRYRKDSDIRFVFSAACKCCGATKGRIKELRANNYG
jgi:hypothetical protein